ncbi:MAG: metal-dependent hydrolase, partial [Chlorobiota bacterium]
AVHRVHDLLDVLDPRLVGAAEPDGVDAGVGDHLGDALPIAKRTGSIIVSNFEIAQYCEKQGAKVHAMHIGGAHSFAFGKVKLTPAWHGSSFPDGTYGGTPAGLLFTLDGKTIYHAGDTGLFGDMKLIGESHTIDLALLPIGDNFTMGITDAVKAVEFVSPKFAVPIHYNTFPVIIADPNEFKKLCESKGHQVKVLKFGEEIEL